MALIIDRFERNIAVCECPDKTFIKIDRCLLPEHSKEGDFITTTGDGKYSIDTKSTSKTRERISKKMDALWK